MLRRDFVRAILSISIAPKVLLAQQTAKPALPPPAPVPWTLGLNPKTPLPHTVTADEVTQTDARFFSAVQMATLVRLSDVLVPSLGTLPSASQAGTPVFLDFLIGTSPAPRQKVYTGGLDWLETESQKKYGKEFAKLDDAQVDASLKPWLRTWMSDHPPTEPHADFINIAHDDIRSATVNSKAWSDAQSKHSEEWTEAGLYWAPIEPDMHGMNAASDRVPPHVRAAPKASHTMPSYPR